jgi:hypothetical protein
MSPQLEAVLIATLGTISASCAIIAWAFHRLAKGGDRWTHAANQLARRVTAHDKRLTALEAPDKCEDDGGTDPRLSVAPEPANTLWITSREEQ